MMGHRVTWDEANIREYEERKPARKKIPEPKTPYHPMIDTDDDSASPSQNSGEFIDNSAHAEALIRALNEVASSSQRRSGSWTSSDDEIGAGDPVKDEFLKSFMYNEEREIEIESSNDDLRIIEIEGSEVTAGDVEILEGNLLASAVISSHSGKLVN